MVIVVRYACLVEIFSACLRQHIVCFIATVVSPDIPSAELEYVLRCP